MQRAVALTLAAAASGANLRAASGACVPPNPGQSVVSLDCGTAGATTAATFTTVNNFTGLGYFAVTGTSPALCFTVSGVVPDDGAPAIALQYCDKTGGNAAQLFTFMLDGSIVSGLNGECLDLESGVKAPNERLELFSCSSGAPNQTFNMTASGLLDAVWGYCVGVCS